MFSVDRYKRFMGRLAVMLSVLILPTSCIMEKVADESVRKVVLVYMASEAFSSYSFSNKNIEWMQNSLGSGMDNAALLVYVDKAGLKPCLLRVRRGRTSRDPGLDTLKIYNEMNSADPGVLRLVIDEVKQLYPCNSYGLVLWSHGTGWIPQSYLKNTELGWSAPKRGDGDDMPRNLEFDFEGGTKAILVDRTWQGGWLVTPGWKLMTWPVHCMTMSLII